MSRSHRFSSGVVASLLAAGSLVACGAADSADLGEANSLGAASDVSCDPAVESDCTHDARGRWRRRQDAGVSATTDSGVSTPPPVVVADSGVASVPPTADSGVTPPISSGACKGFPDATCTGWQHTGVTLQPYMGPEVITVDGTVIDGKDVSGILVVEANNVTIKRSRIRGNSYWLLLYASGKNLVVEDTEISRANSCLGKQDACLADYGIEVRSSGGVSISRVNISNVTSGIHLGSNAVVQDSFVHDLVNISGEDHNDAIISNGGTSKVVIRHNALEVPMNQTTPLAMYQDFGINDDWLVDNNLLNGGGYCMYPGGSNGKFNTNLRVINNHFGKKFYPSCGYFGASIHWDGRPDQLWSGNVWDDGSGTLTPP